MKDKKAAKKIIKRAKKHPNWYTEQEVYYAKMVRKRIKNEERLSKINKNEDGSFTVEWDKQDPDWKWMNDLTSKEIQVIIEQAIKYDNAERV